MSLEEQIAELLEKEFDKRSPFSTYITQYQKPMSKSIAHDLGEWNRKMIIE